MIKSFGSALAMACTLGTSGAAVSQATSALDLLTNPTPLPMLGYTIIGRFTEIPRADIFEIEVAESGGITDVFLRLSPRAGAELGDFTELGSGFAMTVSICGRRVWETDAAEPNGSATLYIPNLTFVQADALRAVWHGRETCSTLPPEVFANAP